MRFRQKIILLVSGLLIPFLIFEVVLRIRGTDQSIYTQDRATGLITLKPNDTFTWAKSCYSTKVQTNSFGFHDYEFKKEKDPGVFRIAVLGDSYVEALQVPTDKSFHNLLEQELNQSMGGSPKVEVYALGKSGNGTFANDLYLRRYALQFHPDLIIDAFLPGNDYRDDSPGLAQLYIAQTGDTSVSTILYPEFDSSGNLTNADSAKYLSTVESQPNGLRKAVVWLASKSAVAHWLYNKYVSVKTIYYERKNTSQSSRALGDQIPVDNQVSEINYTNDVWNQAWVTEERLFADMKNVASQAGAKFMVVSLTDEYRLTQSNTETMDYTKPETLLGQIASRQGFDYLALLPIFKDRMAKTGQDPHLTCDGHWNETGHQWAADALANYLEAHPQLLGKSN